MRSSTTEKRPYTLRALLSRPWIEISVRILDDTEENEERHETWKQYQARRYGPGEENRKITA